MRIAQSLNAEPVAWGGLIAIAINLAVSFGLQLSPEQVGMINALAVGIIALLVRRKVSPV